MNIPPISAAMPSAQNDSAQAAKATKAGTEFEAVLLNTVLGGLQRVFSQLPGDHQNSVNKSYDGMAMQALATGMAHSGGLGLAKLISRELIKAESARSTGT